jgi:putative nucleotidyltransferase with HDIG domain
MNPERRKKPVDNLFKLGRQAQWALLFIAISVFSILLYPSLIVKKHTYNVGDVVERDIKAPEDFFIEDKAATEINRKTVVDKVLTVYDLNPELAGSITDRIYAAFEELQLLFASREYKDSATMQALDDFSDETTVMPTNIQQEEKEFQDQVWQKKKHFEEVLDISISTGAYRILYYEKFSRKISDLIIQIITEVMNNGIVANKEVLLKNSESGITLRSIGTGKEQTIHNLRRFYGPDQAKTMVRIIGQPLLEEMRYSLINLVVDFSQRLLQPNISLNQNETEKRKKEAAESIKPILYKIKAGEMLLREGEIVTAVDIVKLNAIEEQSEQGAVFITSTGAAILLLCLLLIAYNLTIRYRKHFTTDRNKNLLFIVCMFTAMLIFAKFAAVLADTWAPETPFSIPAASLFYGIPLAYGAMVVCLFLGVEIALSFAMITAVCTAILFQNRLELFIYFLLNSIMAAYWVQHCRERKVIIKAGAKIGLLSIVLALAIDLYLNDFSGLKLPWDCTFAFMGGITAGVITVGIAPLVEIGFHYTTDITLLELANLDRPLLRRLMLEAPGTYHHSVIVGSLVEAAASEIGANPLLAKVCGYYHDIGKINKPLYFIENQTNGRNKHDKLAPSMSSLILIAHRKDGVEIAKQNKLGQVIINTIEQHHGTSLISYFYEKAKQLRGEENVNIDDFRYPGPRPQTKEAGLVMLADVVEAASRTLENPTPSRIQGLVQNLVNKIFSDGQLDDCELTLKDLHRIAKSFHKILNGIHHHRIEYADQQSLKNGKGKNGSSDRQQTNKTRSRPQKDPDQGEGHLKRLGLS